MTCRSECGVDTCIKHFQATSFICFSLKPPSLKHMARVSPKKMCVWELLDYFLSLKSNWILPLGGRNFNFHCHCQRCVVFIAIAFPWLLKLSGAVWPDLANELQEWCAPSLGWGSMKSQLHPPAHFSLLSKHQHPAFQMALLYTG